MSLLKDAKATRKNPKLSDPSPEEVELAVAWAKGDISLSQADAALAKSKGNTSRNIGTYITLARGLRKYINDKNI